MSKKKTHPKIDPKASKKPVPPPPAQQLVIFAPPHITLEAVSLVAKTNVAALIFALPHSDTRSNITHFKNLLHPFQDLGIACFIENDAEVAVMANADGIHITNHAHLDEALRHTPKKSIGLGNVQSRDEAFVLADNPIDYILFGDIDMPLAKLTSQLNTWVEDFEIPCIGFAKDEATARAIKATKAEFCALGAWSWQNAALFKEWA